MPTRTEVIDKLKKETKKVIRDSGGHSITVIVIDFHERNERVYDMEQTIGPPDSNGCRIIRKKYKRDYELQLVVKITYKIGRRTVTSQATSPWYKVTGEVVEVILIDCPPGCGDIIYVLVGPKKRPIWSGSGEIMLVNKTCGHVSAIAKLNKFIKSMKQNITDVQMRQRKETKKPKLSVLKRT